MAADQNQPQPVVLDGRIVPTHRIRSAVSEPPGQLGERGVKRRTPAHGIDGFEAAGRDNTRARIRGHAVARPLLHCRGERVVQGLLGEVEVAEQADQRSKNAPRL
jgi:hypothetical protein